LTAAHSFDVAPFALRPETPADRHYVLSTWRRSEQAAQGVRRSRGAQRPLTPDEQKALQRFQDAHVAMTDAVLARPSTRILVAHPGDSEDAIAGWLCHRPAARIIHKGPGQYTGPIVVPAPIVYFLYVRDEVRHFGIARMLLGELVTRNDVLYTSTPGDEKTSHGWRPHRLPIPRSWTYEPRAAFVEVS
jgi:hypothetical protein